MKKIMLLLLSIILLSLIACDKSPKEGEYRKISAEEAKKMLDENKEAVLIDVRTSEEFEAGHIQGSILIPYDVITEQIESVVADKKTAIIVYCRSGNRSKKAADALIAMGYSQVYDMGGIVDWPYEITE
jgi:phage shock protein E